jgi:hypothetical protein
MLRVVFEYQGHDNRWVEITTLWFRDARAVLYVVEKAASSHLLAQIIWRVRISVVLTY